MVQNYFPQLENRVYFDNAGGTQLPIQVLEKITNFLKNTYVQPCGYSIQSILNTKMIEQAKNFVSIMMNNRNGNIILGPSATQIASNVSKSLVFHDSDEIIVSSFSHESAISTFENISNVNIKYWNVDHDLNYDINKLTSLISNKTKLIVIPHVSNILGNILDIKSIISKIKCIDENIKVYVDGVAYLPHNIIDVCDYNADFYVVSFYKFLGTRISALYIKNGILNNMKNLNHYFLDGEKKLEIGNIQYEQCVSLIGVKNYLCDVIQEDKFNRNVVVKNFEHIRQKELELIEYFDTKMNDFKNTNLKILTNTKQSRVPIFSIYGKQLDKLCFFLNKVGIECKYGTFYCDRLLEYLNIEGVLRISLAHYNSSLELDLLFHLLNEYKSNTITNVNSISFDLKLSEIVKNSFNNLELDKYYDNERYRAFSMIDLNNFSIVGESYFLQSKDYNNYLGDQLRIYENIDLCVVNDKSFQSLVLYFINKINTSKEYKYLYVHQIRVICEDTNTNPVPEGIHRDGYEYICISCVNKENIDGPVTQIYDNNKLIKEFVLEEDENIILNDRKYLHNVCSLKKLNNNENAYRDIFVFTTVL